MSEALKPTRWHLGMPIGRDETGDYLVCPECGEFVSVTSPIEWTLAWGPRPGWVHLLDGQPLCPVINTGDGVSGYVPANPVTRREFDDANGCPCEATYSCKCACTSCSCRSDAQLWRRLEDSDASGDMDGDDIPVLLDDRDAKCEEVVREATLAFLHLQLGEDLDSGPDQDPGAEGVISHG